MILKRKPLKIDTRRGMKHYILDQLSWWNNNVSWCFIEQNNLSSCSCLVKAGFWRSKVNWFGNDYMFTSKINWEIMCESKPICSHCLKFLETQWNWQSMQSLHKKRTFFLFCALKRTVPIQTSAFHLLSSPAQQCYLWPRAMFLEALAPLHTKLIEAGTRKSERKDFMLCFKNGPLLLTLPRSGAALPSTHWAHFRLSKRHDGRPYSPIWNWSIWPHLLHSYTGTGQDS